MHSGFIRKQCPREHHELVNIAVRLSAQLALGASSDEHASTVETPRAVNSSTRSPAVEKIDVVPWSADASVFVANALSPAQVLDVSIDEELRIASVMVPERMLSLAIGREGQNARLAAKLTGWRIDIRSDAAPVSDSEGTRTGAASG